MIYKLGGTTEHHDFREAVIGCVEPNPCGHAEGTDGADFSSSVLERFGLLPKE